MSILRIYNERSSSDAREILSKEEISSALKAVGIRFEQWVAEKELTDDSTQEEILDAYNDPVSRLMHDCGYATADVISVHPETPHHPDLRKKFLSEHTHSEDEARFFVDGSGLFYLHIGEEVFGLLCTKGDFLSVPAGTRHWFDMGDSPRLKCIRTFTTPEGWVANYTGSSIADRFPLLDAFVGMTV